MSEARPSSVAPMDAAALDAVRRHLQERGGEAPRIAVFLFECPDVEDLRKMLARIPEELEEWIEEVVVMQDGASPAELPPPREILEDRGFPLVLHRNPRDYGYGGTRKAAFEYALRRDFDLAVVMRGDGRHPPEALPTLLRPALVDGRAMVFAAPLAHRTDGFRSGAGADRALARMIATGVQNALLGLDLSDYHSGFRVYAVDALRRIPFQLDADDGVFDAEIIVQARALGASVEEVPVSPPWNDDPDETGSWTLARSGWTALDYRLHQLHVTKAGRFLVDLDVHYTLKRHASSSHMQIVDAIRPESTVLDLGCSQGLLAAPLRKKGVSVTGVDIGPPERVAAEMDAYYQRDLEEPLELPTGRVFDYVVVSDVIEHVKNRAQLLRTARRYLKEDGRLLISTPNVALWFYRLSLLAGRFEYGPRGVLDETHVHLYTGASFRREVEKAGFHVLRQRVTSLPFEVVFHSTGRSRVIRRITDFYHALARLWPSMFAYQHILEAEFTTLDEESTSH